jgi:hypothetical protein
MKDLPRLVILGGVLLAGWLAAPPDLGAQRPRPQKPQAVQAPATADQLLFFEKHIRPVLVKECYSCHSTTARKIRGNLTLDTRDAIREGGDTGPAVVPGNPNKSLLLRALRHQGDLKPMPPKIW